MIVQIFVIAGYVGSLVEECLKLLQENQWYVWKSIFEKPCQSNFRESGHFVRTRIPQFFSELGLSLVCVQPFAGLQLGYDANCYRTNRRFSRLSSLPIPLAVIYHSHG